MQKNLKKRNKHLTLSIFHGIIIPISSVTNLKFIKFRGRIGIFDVKNQG